MIMIIGVLIGAAVAVAAALTPVVTSGSPSATRGPERSEATLRQTAQAGLDSYSGGSYGDFWDLWSTQAQTAVAREEYVRLFQLCPQPVPDVRFTITAVTVGGDTAKVQAGRLNDTTDFDFLFEGDAWRYVPPAEELQEYRAKSVDQLAQQRQTAGTCGAASPPSPSTPATPPG
ncbi:hypothetical protein FHR32_002637 [Streptosporangium album]|uniref:DUF4878 domain-containing protein n=1 Tax=Streptosporangium album TaxID=47479 RepID=A0A7W7RUT7_9ACTN|nr:hypothetical protein [Streptosporangium album]MBB4938332.1 hypothetical protein [Streptosporangium album]